MGHWREIREAAATLRAEVFAADADGLVAAAEAASRVTEHLGLLCVPEHPGSSNLRGALAVIEDDCIYFNNTIDGWFRQYCIAHEAAHFVLHHRSMHCSSSDIGDIGRDEENVGSAEAAVGYGAGERREREANAFAMELLAPSSVLRKAFAVDGLKLTQIADALEMPPDIVAGPLAHAVLVPVNEVERKALADDKPTPDPSQKYTAEWTDGPLLVSAGPGTGKTHTLTARIEYLLKNGIDPHRILALTFSNKAAEEMRERVETDDADAAARMQIMTFHAFALDILRRYWQEVGLEPTSRLLDRIDAVLYLEQNLDAIGLEHFQNLHEPARNLPAILSAISRAKDELCGPADYRKLGEAMMAAANDEDSKATAEKVIETARVYEFYQRYLDEEKLLDFGDLLFKAVRLLQENEAVRREMRRRYDAILVDEYQDVNRACGVLLKEVAADGASLWAVGDLRQSIYRWRGASPANLNLFDRDFPGAATRSLQVNYRSKGEIVDLFAHFAVKMTAGGGAAPFAAWEPIRGRTGDDSVISYSIAGSVSAEASEIARRVREHLAAGIAYKDQALICRTHNQLKKFGEVLTAEGIPIFYLGDIFEREEVRDLLSLLDLRAARTGFGLVRVARFPEYDIPPEDVKRVIAASEANEGNIETAITAVLDGGEVSEEGAYGLRVLLGHLTAVPEDASAWEFLTEYLFNLSKYLLPCLDQPTVTNSSKLLAIYQFLQSAENIGERFDGPERIAEFIKHVRTLSWFGEDRNFSQMPAAAAGLDAVRLLTVHSAKGLEFPVVYLPHLGAGKFPGTKHGETCPNPTGLIEQDVDHHVEEEECLFFVAMSRARDYLHLSRATRYGQTNSNESKFLTALVDKLPAAAEIAGGDDEPEVPEAADNGSVYYLGSLKAYLKCPRKYYYNYVLQLRHDDEASIYLKFHSSVHDTIESLEAIARNPEIELNEDTALARFEEFWQAAEIDDHPYAPIYRRTAVEMVRAAVSHVASQGGDVARPTYAVRLRNGTVRVQPYSLRTAAGGETDRIVIRQYKTGRPPKKEAPGEGDPLVVHAARLQHPDAEVLLERVYLSDNSVRDVSITDRVIGNHVEKYEQAIDGINAGHFPPKTDEKVCPRCPHYFICPSGG